MKLRALAFFAFCALSSTAFADGASQCKNRIIFLPQTHPTILTGRLEVLPENFERTARSQYSIARYLEQNRSLPVFSEQISSETTFESVSPEFRKAAGAIKSVFPNGLAPTFEELSPDQKQLLARSGGDGISFILRNTESLHRVVENDEIENQLIGKVSSWAQKNPTVQVPPPEIFDTIFSVREKMALDQINNYLRANPTQRDVILIYGSAHSDSFRSHPDKFPPNCILVPREFQSAITSPYEPVSNTQTPAAAEMKNESNRAMH